VEHIVRRKLQGDGQMDFSRLRDANRVSLDILITDIELAFSFLQIAETSTDPKTRERNIKNARKVYDSSLHFLPRLHPIAKELQTIEAKLALLRKRLRPLGGLD
jgi:hypothetical protein